MKKKYRLDMHQKLKELTDKADRNQLMGNNLRHKVYKTCPSGPFDPDAAIIVETIAAGDKTGTDGDDWLANKKAAQGSGPSSLAMANSSGSSRYQKQPEDSIPENSSQRPSRPVFNSGKIGRGRRGDLLAGLSKKTLSSGPDSPAGRGRGVGPPGGLMAIIQNKEAGGGGSPMAGGLMDAINKKNAE